ncbi:hypothetical protein [Mammaliicoccus vitulinus]|uniref:hypothetical protein n=1 Tax=Mammaliicoccus vitulinus TaxID=71237 RepID=UPI00248BD755|nr:hypothetical protein [Mammaliicoccus vitulinus]
MNKLEYKRINEVIDTFINHKANTWGDKETLLESNTPCLIKSIDDYDYGKTFSIEKKGSYMCLTMRHSDINEISYCVCMEIEEICERLKDNFEMDIECYEVQGL